MGVKAWIAAAAAAAALATAGGAGATVYIETGTLDTSTLTFNYGAQGQLVSISGEFTLPTAQTVNVNDLIGFRATLTTPINLDSYPGTEPAAATYPGENIALKLGTDSYFNGSLGFNTTDFSHPDIMTYFGWGLIYEGVPGAPAQTFSGTYKFTANVVPEPATWLMAIIGVGLLGLALRRRAAQGSLPLQAAA